MKIFLMCLILMMAVYAMAFPAVNDTRIEEEENGEGRSEFFIREMMELIANKNSTQEEERQKRFLNIYSELDQAARVYTTALNTLISDNGNLPVAHGNTVALQRLYNKYNWMSCSGNTCVKDHCPRLYMEGTDWTECQGSVFQIYRMNGEGSVHVGDAVGLYYPAGYNWFSMAGGTGHRYSCPGLPTSTNGFQNQDKWLRCYGEVFRIYARGRSNGDIIYEHDDIMLFYVNTITWVGLVEDLAADLRRCPGTHRPPPADKYDECWGEVFELWKK